MPTYEYQCQSCGHELEIFQQMSDPLKRKCPECSRLKLQRLIGIGSGVIFKGGGFYETDYRGDSYKKAAEAEKKSAQPAAADGAPCPCGADAKSQAANGCAATPGKSSNPSTEPAAKRESSRKPVTAR